MTTEWFGSAAPQTVFLAAPGREDATAAALDGQMRRLRQALHAAGLDAADCVATALPNGPDMASLFAGLAAHAVAAPLNPALRLAEARFVLADVGARALIVDAVTAQGEVAAAARALGLALLHLEPHATAGCFDLRREGAPAAAQCPAPAGTGLLLHTSGTTARPKLVPLLRSALAESAVRIAASLQLGPGDRSLTIMPLFHIHGLVAAVLAPWAAGSAVWVPPGGFQAARFLRWLQESQATWYSAVPAMHQMILLRAKEQPVASRLRFVRSSSAPLPEPVWAGLERCFGVPVVSAYGMTEAAHQIACTGLPADAAERGSVGLPRGVEVTIRDREGLAVADGTTGEVWLRGTTISPGYLKLDPPETRTAGWFRTGDQGVVDERGRLRLVGRLKELINSGGEKVSPYEVEAALLQHPAVLEAVCFSVPHAVLGEEVGAAVVAREDQSLHAAELRSFAARHLAPCKVPRTVVVTPELPKGPTGKLQRNLMAGLLGLTAPGVSAPPPTAVNAGPRC